MKVLPGMENTKEDQTKIVRSQKYQQDQKKLKREIYVSFRNQEDVNSMARLLNVDITQKTKVFTYPINNLFSDTQEVASITKEKVSRRSEVWRKYWKQMPDYVQDDNPPFKQITIRFGSEADVDSFSKLISQNITDKTKSIWHPKLAKDDNAKKRWVIPEGVEELMPKHPIYIVSKGRWESRITAKSLERMRVPYYIVVEPQEVENYEKETDSRYGTVLALDMDYKKRYDVCDDLGLTKSTGPGPARNFAWDHSKDVLGAESHWVMDDNIVDFYRLHMNERVRFESGAGFRACEDFVERFENVPVSGLQYRFFIAPNGKYPPFVFNTRIYSCLLIRNDCKFKWRGRYNEDTDLSLRVLKDGDCTLQFNAFLQGKAATQTVAGGNTAEFYGVEDQTDDVLHGTSNKSDMQYRLHPDVSRNVWKYGRWHHEVNYLPFKTNKPILNRGLKFTDEPNNYGFEFTNRWGIDQP